MPFKPTPQAACKGFFPNQFLMRFWDKLLQKIFFGQARDGFLKIVVKIVVKIVINLR